MHDSQEECIRICVYVSALLCPGPGRHSLKSRRSKKYLFSEGSGEPSVFRSAGVACRRTAEKEGLLLSTEKEGRALKVLVLNLMPTKLETELQLARLLGRTPLPVKWNCWGCIVCPAILPPCICSGFISLLKRWRSNIMMD